MSPTEDVEAKKDVAPLRFVKWLGRRYYRQLQLLGMGLFCYGMGRWMNSLAIGMIWAGIIIGIMGIVMCVMHHNGYEEED